MTDTPAPLPAPASAAVPLPQEPQVARWEFDPATGQILAFDGGDRRVMAIAAHPLFGPRLAAAFSSPAPQPRPRSFVGLLLPGR
jgi:hypothetical protein